VDIRRRNPPLDLRRCVIVSTHLYGYLRVHRDDSTKPHRWAYLCATVVLASQAAVLVLVTGIDTYPDVPGPTEVRAWLVVFAAVFARLGDQVNEVAAAALAVVVAVLLEQGYSVPLVCVYLVVVLLQQTSCYHQWKRERPFDLVTGPYSRASFLEQSTRRKFVPARTFRPGGAARSSWSWCPGSRRTRSTRSPNASASA
jgi:hypothetical protein